MQFYSESSGIRIERLEISGGELYKLFFQTDWEQLAKILTARVHPTLKLTIPYYITAGEMS